MAPSRRFPKARPSATRADDMPIEQLGADTNPPEDQ